MTKRTNKEAEVDEVIAWDDVVAEDRAADPHRDATVDAGVARLENRVERYQAALAEVRKARHLTQVQLAKALGISQGEVSRIEHQADLFVSTLRSYLDAAGGDLVLVARFPGTGDVEVETEVILGDPAHRAG